MSGINVPVQFTGDFAAVVSGFTAAMAQAAGGAGRALGGLGDRMRTSMAAAARQIGADLRSVFQGAGQVAGLAFAGLAASFASFIPEAIAASDATDKFKQTLGFAKISQGDIERLTQSTRAYADQTVYSLSDVQSITAQLASNGVKGYDQLAIALGGLNAVAGGNAETFKRVGSVLTQTAGAGKLTTENWNQLAEAIPGAAGPLQKALQDAGAYTGNFREAMSKGQITAEEFNTALTKLGMSPAAQEAAKSTKTIEGAVGNLQATIVGGLSDAINAMKPALTGIIGLFNDALTPAMKALGDGAKAAAPAVKVFVDALAGNSEFGEFEGGLRTLNDVAISIRETFGTIGGVVGGFFSSLSGGQQAAVVVGGLAGAFLAMGSAIAPLLGPFGALLPSLSQLAPLLRLATGPLGLIIGLFSGLMANSEAFRGAIAGIGAQLAPLGAQIMAAVGPIAEQIGPVMEQLNATFAQVGDALAPVITALVGILVPIIGSLISALAPLVAQLMSALVPALQLAGQIISMLAGVLMSTLIPAFQALLPAIQTTFGVLSSIIGAALNVVVSIIKTVMAVLKGDWAGAWEGLVSIFQGVWNLVATILDGAIKIVMSTLQGLWSWVGPAAMTAWNAVLNFTAGIWRSIFAAVGGAVRSVQNAVSSAWNSVVSANARVWSTVIGAVTGAWGRVTGAVSSGVNSVLGFVRGLPGQITGALGNLGGLLYTAGQNMIQGMINGVRDMAGNIASSARSVVEGAVNAAKNALGIASPSRVFIEIGKQTGLGLAEGLDSMNNTVAQAGRGMAEAVVGASRPVLGSSSNSGASSGTGAPSGAAVVSGGFTYAPRFYGPTTGAGRLQEMDWAGRYSANIFTPDEGDGELGAAA